MFVLSFKNGNNDPARYSFDKYYIPLVEIKHFNALINNKPFFWSASKKQGYEKFIEMSINDEYATGNLLDYFYHQKCYKLFHMDISRQTNMSIPQQI